MYTPATKVLHLKRHRQQFFLKANTVPMDCSILVFIHDKPLTNRQFRTFRLVNRYLKKTIMPTIYANNVSRYRYALTRFPHLFAKRATNSHKGTFGTLAVVGGSEGMSGAVVLAATAAIYNGCGKVWAGFNQPVLPAPWIPDRPEIMLSTADALCARNDIQVWVCGCGLNTHQAALNTLENILTVAQNTPLLLDADALNLTAQHPHLAQTIAQRTAPTILTPHPTEAARLLGCTTAEIQSDRPAAAQTLANRFQAATVLKGHRTVVAQPNGQFYENDSGNPGLATAGSGDVLSGLIGALLAQNLPVWEAVCGGVWLHGAAADWLRDNGIGEIGMLSGELAEACRWLRNGLIDTNND